MPPRVKPGGDMLGNVALPDKPGHDAFGGWPLARTASHSSAAITARRASFNVPLEAKSQSPP